MARLDIAAARRHLAQSTGREYWKGLEALAGDPTFATFLHDEFPRLASLWEAPVERRAMLKLMGASLALGGLTACGRLPGGKLVPYVERPERVIPGNAQYFATTLTSDGYGQGVLVESHTGRPTFVEGNPHHPASRGAMDPMLQAAVLELYDPDRSQGVLHDGQITAWKAFLAMLQDVRPAFEARRGEGLRLLTPSVTSPSLAAQIQTLLQRYPKMHWHQHDAVGREQIADGARLAFGQPLDTHYDLTEAAVIVSLDADFLGAQPGHLAYARQFAAARRLRDGAATMSRLYAIESTPTVTGAAADHRWAAPASQIEAWARALGVRLGLELAVDDTVPLDHEALDAMVRDLEAHGGRCAIIPGDHQLPQVHAIAQAINATLGNFGATVLHSEPVAAQGAETLADLVTAMDRQQVDVLVILDTNPVYDAPADLDFGAHLAQIPLTIHCALYRDETAQRCHWHINRAHPLESWGDLRAYEGTVSLVQPLIAPLYDGKTPTEILAVLAGSEGADAHTLLRAYWQERHGAADFETFWNGALGSGVVPDSAAPTVSPAIEKNWAAALPKPPEAVPGLVELQFRPDPAVWDGRYANNGWLQELPRPLSKLCWDNAALIAPATAERLDLTNGEVVEIRSGGRRVQAPVWIMPGQPRDAVTVHLGYGRTHAGQLGNAVGVDAYRLRTVQSPWIVQDVRLRKTGAHHSLATTQLHHSMEGRRLVRSATLQEFRANPGFAQSALAPYKRRSLSPPYAYDGNSWGMVIDLGACIGCNACIAACQNENNTPIVGKEEVARGHDMHWLRVDRYYQGDLDRPTACFEPVPCMQCELAPCEYACPVGATVHDGEGINDMVYNRCIGTRFCSQNCPYKVRRFNWLDYMGAGSPTPAAVNNPDVTVRARGVMEKCTYCIQRISAARIAAARDNRALAPDAVKTACQAACPTRAIVFGDLGDKRSAVSVLKRSPLNYSLLEELNTRPRTTYLAQVRNPNPEIGEA